jgi:hypothetical protein
VSNELGKRVDALAGLQKVTDRRNLVNQSVALGNRLDPELIELRALQLGCTEFNQFFYLVSVVNAYLLLLLLDRIFCIKFGLQFSLLTILNFFFKLLPLKRLCNFNVFLLLLPSQLLSLLEFPLFPDPRVIIVRGLGQPDQARAFLLVVLTPCLLVFLLHIPSLVPILGFFDIVLVILRELAPCLEVVPVLVKLFHFVDRSVQVA